MQHSKVKTEKKPTSVVSCNRNSNKSKILYFESVCFRVAVNLLRKRYKLSLLTS